MDLMDIKEFDTFILKRGCVKCRHQWFPRSANPQRCPKCQTWLDKQVEYTPAEPEDGEQKPQ